MPTNLRLAALAAALALALAAPGAAEELSKLYGTIADSETGEPVRRAHVVLTGAGNRYGAFSDSQGRYSLPNLPPGQYSAQVQRLEYVPIEAGHSFQLKPGEERELRFQMTPCGVISGRVLDSEGEPLEGAWVQASGSSTLSSTDEEGRFRIGNLRPGRHLVHAGPPQTAGPPEIRTDGTTPLHHSPTYYPASLQPESASRVLVRPGNEAAGIEIQLLRTPDLRVSGKVLGIPPGPGSAAVLHVRRDGSSVINVRPDGTFARWDWSPGKHRLEAQWRNDGSAGMRSAPLDIELTDAPLDHVELQLRPLVELSGRIEFEGAGQRPDRNGGFTLVATDGSQFLSSGQVGEDGAFRIQRLPAGVVELSLHSDRAYLKAIRFQAQDTAGATLDLGLAGTAAEATLILSTEMAEVSGTVRKPGGAPAPEALIYLFSGGGLAGSRQVRATAAGQYRIGPVPPGALVLLAMETGTWCPASLLQAELLYGDLMERLDLSPGQKLTRDLTLRDPLKE